VEYSGPEYSVDPGYLKATERVLCGQEYIDPSHASFFVDLSPSVVPDQVHFLLLRSTTHFTTPEFSQ